MRKWEINYEKYQSGETEETYENLKQKVQERKANQEEIKEYNKMTRIYENLPKIENLKKYMDILDSDLKLLKDEYNKRMTQRVTNELKGRVSSESNEKMAELNSKINENLAKQDKLINSRKQINKRLDSLSKIDKKSLTDSEKQEIKDLTKEREEVNNSLQKLKGEARENNDKYSEYLKLNKSAKIVTNNEKLESQKTKIEKYTTEELREKCFKIGSQMSKCNLVATSLMNGLSVESIDLKLKKFKEKKFTSKDKLPLTRKEKAEQEKGMEKDDQINEEKEVNKKESSEKTVDNDNKENEMTEDNISNLPIDANDFANAFPKLAKIFPKMEKTKLAKFMVNVKQKINVKKAKKEANKENKEVNEQENNSKNKRAQYRDSLKYDVLDVAVHGFDEVKNEKLKQAKKAAYDRESKEFGEEYAKMSYNEKEDEGR